MAATTFHDWWRLPEELKLHVLSYLLVVDKPIQHLEDNNRIDINPSSYYEHQQLLWDRLFPLIGTRNQHLAALSQEVYYKSNHFVIQLRYSNGPPRYPKQLIAARLHYLIVDAVGYFTGTLEDILLDPEEGWRWLLKPLRSLERAALDENDSRDYLAGGPEPDGIRDTAWQTMFTNLQDLELKLDIHGLFDFHRGEPQQNPGEICCIPSHMIAVLEACFADTEVALRARRVHANLYITKGYPACDKHSHILAAMARTATKAM
jgi:hypothetical protein